LDIGRLFLFPIVWTGSSKFQQKQESHRTQNLVWLLHWTRGRFDCIASIVRVHYCYKSECILSCGRHDHYPCYYSCYSFPYSARLRQRFVWSRQWLGTYFHRETRIKKTYGAAREYPPGNLSALEAIPCSTMHRPGIEPGAGRHFVDPKICEMATANFTTKPPMLICC
jgi:hypothetical protein